MTQRVKLSHAFIDGEKPPRTGRATYADTDEPGLYLRISASGVRSFSVVAKQKNGRTVRVTLGRYPKPWSVEAARREARRVAGEIAAGADIAARQHAERNTATFGEVFELYVADRIAAGKRRMDSTRETYERWLGLLPDRPRKPRGRLRVKPPGAADWSNRRIDAIAQRDVAILFERIRSGGHPTTANRALEIVSAVYGFARRRRLFDGVSPSEGIAAAPEQTRARFLRADELGPFFDALAQLEQPWRDYFSLLLLLGYRRRATAAMRWADVDLEPGVWRVPVESSKSGEPVVLPLVGDAAAILKRRKTERDKAAKRALPSPFVFPAVSASGHLASPQKPWKRLVTLAGVADLRMHDLRRSLGSWLAMSGYSLPMIGKALGHRDAKSTEVYARLQVEPIAAAVGAAHAAMRAASKNKIVVTLPKRRRRA